MMTLNQTSPKVGDKATVLQYGDKQACTVVAVSASGRQVTVRHDKAENLETREYLGYSDKFAISPDPNGRIRVFSLRTSKTAGSRFVEVGEPRTWGPVLDLTRHTHSEDWMR